VVSEALPEEAQEAVVLSLEEELPDP